MNSGAGVRTSLDIPVHTMPEVSGFSVPGCRFASDGICDRFQPWYFSTLTPETRKLTPRP